MSRSKKSVSRAQWLQYVGLELLALVTLGVVAFALLEPKPAPPASTLAAVPSVKPTPKPTADSSAPMTIWFTGDSLTKGLYASTEEQGFSRLAAAYLDKSRELTARFTSEAGANLARVSSEYPIPEGLDVAVVELGTNDAGKGTEVEAFTVNYADYLSKIKAASPDVSLVCLGIWGSGANAELIPFNETIERQCVAAGGLYIPLSGMYSMPEMRSVKGAETWAGPADDFHPSDTGHVAIANAVVARIEP